jgi:hypothetical protein
VREIGHGFELRSVATLREKMRDLPSDGWVGGWPVGSLL